jgi:tRNA (cytidine/uridine-2'-O-)-methyltransferase
VGTGSALHLVGPLGFDISESAVRRAGLDYWERLDLHRHESLETMMPKVADPKRVFYFSKKAKKTFYDLDFQLGDWLVFGKETKGLPADLLERVEPQVVRIPMWGPIRSLNLSNSVSIVLYEALRQTLVSSQTPEIEL